MNLGLTILLLAALDTPFSLVITEEIAHLTEQAAIVSTTSLPEVGRTLGFSFHHIDPRHRNSDTAPCYCLCRVHYAMPPPIASMKSTPLDFRKFGCLHKTRQLLD